MRTRSPSRVNFFQSFAVGNLVPWRSTPYAATGSQRASLAFSRLPIRYTSNKRSDSRALYGVLLLSFAKKSLCERAERESARERGEREYLSGEVLAALRLHSHIAPAQQHQQKGAPRHRFATVSRPFRQTRREKINLGTATLCKTSTEFYLSL